MGKVVILTCEVCKVIDSVDNRVVTANVAGHRVELCATERIRLLEMVNVSPEHAEAYVRVYDEQAGTKGTNPSMAQVLEMFAAAELEANEGSSGPEAFSEVLEDLPPEEETEEEVTPVKRRR